MIAQPIRTQFAFQFFVAILTFTPFAVLVVSTVGQCSGTKAVGYDSSAVGPLAVRFALEDDSPRLLPGAGLVVKAGKETLRLAGLSVLFNRVLQ